MINADLATFLWCCHKCIRDMIGLYFFKCEIIEIIIPPPPGTLIIKGLIRKLIIKKGHDMTNRFSCIYKKGDMILL